MVGDFTSSYCTGELFQTWKKWWTPMGPPLPPLAPVFQLQGCPRSPQWDVDIPFVSCVAEEAPVRCSAAKMLKATKHKWCWSWSWNTHVLKKISYSTTKKNEKKQKNKTPASFNLLLIVAIPSSPQMVLGAKELLLPSLYGSPSPPSPPEPLLKPLEPLR